jgi:hypothetical protein
LAGLEGGFTTVIGDKLDFNISVFLDDDTLLVAVEITFSHVSDMGLNLFVPRLHGVGVLLGVHLDGISDTPI